MNQSTYNERKSLSDWACKDVDAIYEKISKVGSGTYGYSFFQFPCLFPYLYLFTSNIGIFSIMTFISNKLEK